MERNELMKMKCEGGPMDGAEEELQNPREGQGLVFKELGITSDKHHVYQVRNGVLVYQGAKIVPHGAK